MTEQDREQAASLPWRTLDPRRDAARWEATVRRVAQRVIAERPRRTLSRQLLSWRGPTLGAAVTLAAAAAALLWARADAEPVAGGAASAASATPTAQLVRWARADDVPPVPELLTALEATHGSH